MKFPGEILLGFIFTGIYFIERNQGYYRDIVVGALFTLFFFFAGIFFAAGKNKAVTYPDADCYKATLLETPVEKVKSYRAEALLTAFLQGDSVQPACEKTMIYFEKGGEVERLRPGICVLFGKRPEEIKNQGNPFEFNYREYAAKRGIYRQVYLKTTDWILSGNDPVFRISVLAEKVRDYLLGIYRSNGLSGTEFEILSALTLGSRKSMDADIRQVFAATGASHVLSVSGLHVGIVYLIFNFFFGFMRKNRVSRVIFLVLAILTLWGFAFITGLSPSVQRSALMFSIVLTGENLKRPANIYNTLAVSAFVLMAINPNILFDIGFQLSYAALFGIVYFQPRLNSLFSFHLKPAGYLWGLFTVSLAAQLMTFPLSCYYFHQFPVYFWLSNFIVIPLSFVFIALGILIFVTSPVVLVSGILARIASWLVGLLYEILRQIEIIPGALISGFNLPVVSLFLFFVLIFVLILFIETKMPRYLLIFMGLAVSGFLYAAGSKIIRNHHKEIIVYKSDEPMIHLIYGRENYVLLSEHIQENEYPGKEITTVIVHERLNKPVIIYLNDSYADQLVVKKDNYLFFDGTIIGFEDKNHSLAAEFLPELLITRSAGNENFNFPPQVQVVSYAKYFRGKREGGNVHYIAFDGAWRIKKKVSAKKTVFANSKQYDL